MMTETRGMMTAWRPVARDAIRVSRGLTLKVLDGIMSFSWLRKSPQLP
jgi:hypothetical protein